MAKSDSEALLSEIARKLRTLQCICENTAAVGGVVVQNYQPVDCNGDPVGDPIDVIPTITVAKQDVSLCNYEQVATAIGEAVNGTYDVAGLYVIGEDATASLSDLGLDMSKLHSVSILVIPGTANTGTVDISGDLGDGNQVATGLPVGVGTGWTASTVFGVGNMSFTTTMNARVLITTTSTA